MSQVTVYSSTPVSNSKLALVLLNLGARVVQRPLAELPAKPEVPRRSIAVLREELLQVTQDLVRIGEQLEEHQTGRCRLDAGLEQGLLYDREALAQRQKAIQESIRAMKQEGQNNG